VTEYGAAGLLILNQAACAHRSERTTQAEQMHGLKQRRLAAAIAAMEDVHCRPRLYGNLLQIAQRSNFQANQGHG
jgi:hypothetical protein